MFFPHAPHGYGRHVARRSGGAGPRGSIWPWLGRYVPAEGRRTGPERRWSVPRQFGHRAEMGEAFAHETCESSLRRAEELSCPSWQSNKMVHNCRLCFEVLKPNSHTTSKRLQNDWIHVGRVKIPTGCASSYLPTYVVSLNGIDR